MENAEKDSTINPHNTYVTIGYHYYMYGEDSIQAKKYFEKALQNSQAVNDEQLSNLVAILLDLYAADLDIERIRQLNDNLLDIYKSRAELARVEAQKWRNKELTLENKISENRSLQENQLRSEMHLQRRNLLLLLLAFLTLGVVLVAYIQYRSNKIKKALLHRIKLQNHELAEQKSTVEKQKERLQELDKTKSRLFFNISHELRTPLTVISGIADQIAGNERARTLIKRNSQHLLNLINQILDLRKLQAGKLQLRLIQADVISYLSYLVESFRSFAASRKVTLQFRSSTEHLVMDHDPERLLRVVTNLLSNAIKFTPEGGQVHFEISEEKRPVQNKGKSEENSLIIRVRDTGIGIAADDLPHIFDRFYQADKGKFQQTTTNAQEGTGIGLALTKELIKLMKGKITVESEEGVGTTFIVSLPITKKAVSKQLATEKNTLVQNSIASGSFVQGNIPENTPLKVEGAVDEENAAVDSGYTVHPKDWPKHLLPAGKQSFGEDLPSILIVEDNPDIAEYLVSCLSNQFLLFGAGNGQEGIDLARKHLPDIIVSDVMMPVKDGFELCQTLKNDENTSHIPIVLLTAKADLESRISGLEKGADAYLAKPFDQRELLARIHGLLEKRLRHLQARNRELERLVEEKTKQMLDARDQLILQEKMASLGQLTAGIAHEIKNPLNFVNNFAEGSIELLEELQEELTNINRYTTTSHSNRLNDILEDLKQNATDIHKSGRRADLIVRSMMAHARGVVSEAEHTDLNALIMDNVNLAFNSFRALEPSFTLQIKKELEAVLPPVQVYPQELGRSLLNIINNACYAVNEKRKNANDDYVPVLKIATRTLPENAEIRIRDNGPGIPQQVIEDIFTPFFTTKSTTQGNAGLGLSISYDIIVQQHKGHIRAESLFGEYTEFIIELPLGSPR